MLPSHGSRIGKFALVIFFLACVVYALYEAQAVLLGPKIHLPSESLVVYEPRATIKGSASNIAELRMNGAPVTVTEDGLFEEPYLFTAGENRIIFDAKDSFGRTTQTSLDVIYLEKESPDRTSPDSSSGDEG